VSSFVFLKICFKAEVCRSWNHGQACCAGSRIFVQDGIYDEFVKRFTEKARAIKIGDPFSEGVDQGPQVSQIQYDVCGLQLYCLPHS